VVNYFAFPAAFLAAFFTVFWVSVGEVAPGYGGMEPEVCLHNRNVGMGSRAAQDAHHHQAAATKATGKYSGNGAKKYYRTPKDYN
jgi:hypothetical protein